MCIRDSIKIASKPMTEQYILTEILGQLIEHDLGVKVEITKGIGGGTTNIQMCIRDRFQVDDSGCEGISCIL